MNYEVIAKCLMGLMAGGAVFGLMLLMYALCVISAHGDRHLEE